ncbi:CDP-alcohol phosphatidyltransferase family protein [Psychromarinibacter sp. C21-152]|uniref:CDP-alcohol phosphatidyltransferase family protein n=1 Tax=Psychromarinibacter sediminicola TaxID=3033385 RepID=A0AAE3NTW9_9RHOB|nr:CDP-alcohol phosphatidyltransferase family protein [Psychromarinibacter sediminicola]MDF0601961.1 CDP-alcohol phosphatidyltransferase family protein [Psychromarinibacter sediminicola]
MAERHHPTLAEIADDLRGGRLRQELRGSWAIAVLYRAPSLPLVWLCARAGLAPMAVTLLGMALALALPALAWALPLPAAPWVVALGGALFQVLDCVDGTLARVTGRSSTRGADMDFFVDMLQWVTLYLAIGLLADRVLGGGWGWTALAGGAASGRLLARMVRDRVEQRMPAPAAPPAPLAPGDWPVVIVAGVSGLLPFLALTGSWLGVSVAALGVYALLDIVDALRPVMRGA